ncbi:MAG: bifunctional diaminohydroxyphosphoribosylaminopyrimidine deaminase/5-amino-6-(5-phosphoribosylamino)uracil reductase RibD [Alphaproteobacteria bacterium]|nr:bifunctional diaminohydroxyphosphoribosylaminopyrimidine deaminase/5-amino-6-(5-phosphoribosylamino)uracil reductase RibD [Alphaproteobacteria bacterium]
MQAALVLARRGLGTTWPNPSVGCVIADAAGYVAGRGTTRPGGRPHAETEALRQAGEGARGGTAYVTLEPCAHHGKTPPCADALVAAGIARCVVGTQDPDMRTAGRGLAALKTAGIGALVGVLGAEAREVTAGFLTRVEKGRPLFLLKSAMTLDGRIAAHTGRSRWISGEASRQHGHLLRAQSDAILVGIGTAMADDPQLDVRLAGLEGRKPVRIVADARLRLPLTSRLARSARQQPLWVLTRAGVDEGRARAFRELGAEVIPTDMLASGELDLAAAAQALGTRGLTRVLVEGGGRVAASLIRARLVDRIVVFRAGLVMGGDGMASVAAMGVEDPAAAAHFTLQSVARIGDDILETWAARA